MARPKKEEVDVAVVDENVDDVVGVFPTVEEADEQFEEVKKPLQNKTRKLIDELTAKGVAVGYPSDENKWDEDLYQRLDKLNR